MHIGPMHIGSSQALASHSNAGALFSRTERSTLQNDIVVLVCITAVCSLLAVVGVVTTMEFNPDLFLMISG